MILDLSCVCKIYINRPKRWFLQAIPYFPYFRHLAKCTNHLLPLKSYWVHEKNLMVNFCWLARKKWYEFSVSCWSVHRFKHIKSVFPCTIQNWKINQWNHTPFPTMYIIVMIDALCLLTLMFSLSHAKFEFFTN